MSKDDRIEFYDMNQVFIAGVNSSIVPHIHSLINIRKQTYRVISVSYTLDNADDYGKCLCANVYLRKHVAFNVHLPL